MSKKLTTYLVETNTMKKTNIKHLLYAQTFKVFHILDSILSSQQPCEVNIIDKVKRD